MTTLTEFFNKNLSSYPVYPAIGNHDIAQNGVKKHHLLHHSATHSNIENFKKPDRMFNITADLWKDWFDNDALEEYKTKGYYT